MYTCTQFAVGCTCIHCGVVDSYISLP